MSGPLMPNDVFNFSIAGKIGCATCLTAARVHDHFRVRLRPKPGSCHEVAIEFDPFQADNDSRNNNIDRWPFAKRLVI
jgi:hypothetical protein